MGLRLYIGGYGEVVVEKVAWAASIAKDTEYRLPKDKVNILCTFSWMPTCRQSAEGRFWAMFPGDRSPAKEP